MVDPWTTLLNCTFPNVALPLAGVLETWHEEAQMWDGQEASFHQFVPTKPKVLLTLLPSANLRACASL